jgi:CopG family transcriptional regulator / antitoxin EndoAI
MSKQISVNLPDATVALLDRVAGQANRSQLISQAVNHYVKTEGAEKVRSKLKAQGSAAQCERDTERAKPKHFPLVKATKAELRSIERGREAFRRGDYISLDEMLNELESRNHRARAKGPAQNSARRRRVN